MRVPDAQASAPTYAYRLFGHRLRSHERLPVLPEDENTGYDDMDIDLSEGEVPLNLVNPIRSGVCFQATDRQILMTIPGIIRFLIGDGRKITYECLVPLTHKDLLFFLLDNAVIALFYQKGCLPFRGSAVLSPDRQLIFLQGATSNGKTTLAWLLSRQGYQLISDGCCMVRITDGNRAFMYSGLPFCRILKSDQIKLGIDPGEGWPLRKGLFLNGLPIDPVQEPQSVEQIVVLSGDYSNKTSIGRIYGRHKVKMIHGCMLLSNYWGLWSQSRNFMDNLFGFYNNVAVYKLDLARGKHAHHDALELIINLNGCSHE